MKPYGDIIPQFSSDIKLFRKRFPNSFSHENAGAAKAAPAIFSQQPKPPSWHRSCQMLQKLKRMVLSSLVVYVSRGRVYCNPFVTILQPTNYGKTVVPARYSGLFSPVSRNCLQKGLAEALGLDAANAADGAEFLHGLRRLAGHVLQGGIGKDNVSRHLLLLR